jgi:hypothetical protein
MKSLTSLALLSVLLALAFWLFSLAVKNFRK